MKKTIILFSVTLILGFADIFAASPKSVPRYKRINQQISPVSSETHLFYWVLSMADITVSLTQDRKFDFGAGSERKPMKPSQAYAFFQRQKRKKLVVVEVPKIDSISDKEAVELVDYFHEIGYERVLVHTLIGDGISIDYDSIK